MSENQFDPKAGISNNECSVREALVEECPLVWLAPVSQQHWPLPVRQGRGLRTHSCPVSQPPCERVPSCRKQRLNLPELTVSFPAINRINYIHFIWRLPFHGAICVPFFDLDSYVRQHWAITLRKCSIRALHKLNTNHAGGLNCHCAAPVVGLDLRLGGDTWP